MNDICVNIFNLFTQTCACVNIVRTEMMKKIIIKLISQITTMKNMLYIDLRLGLAIIIGNAPV